MQWVRRIFWQKSIGQIVRMGCVAWVAGIAIHATNEQRWVCILPLFFVLAMATCIAGFFAPRFFWIGLLSVVCVGAVWRYDIALPANVIATLPTGKQQFSGRIIDGPRDTPDGTQIQLDRLRDARGAPLAITSFTLTVRVLTSARLRDVMSWQCQPQWSPQIPYSGRCTSRDPPRVLVRTSSVFYRAVFAARQFMSSRARAIMPDPEASFLLGLLIGDDYGMPSTLLRDFRNTGVSHVVAVSGYNVNWVVTAFLCLTCFCGLHRRRAAYVVLLIVWLFVVIVGTQASVVRAAIMGTFQLVAMISRRRYSSVLALLYAGVIMLVINPLFLRHDVGFQLSFSAVFALQWCAPVLEEKLFSRLPRIARKLFLETFSITVITFPLLLFQFGYISGISLAVNAVILPLIPWATGLGAIALLVGMISKTFGLLFASIPFVILRAVLATVAFFAIHPLKIAVSIRITTFFILYACIGFGWYMVTRQIYGHAQVVEKKKS